MPHTREQLQEKIADIDTVCAPARSEDVRKAHEELVTTVEKCGSQAEAQKIAPHVFKRFRVAEAELQYVHRTQEQYRNELEVLEKNRSGGDR